MFILISLFDIEYFVARRALPPFFTFRWSAHLSFVFPILVLWCFFMSIVTFCRSTRHVTVVTIDGVLCFETFVRFAHDAIAFALVTFSVIVMFEAGLAEVYGAEEAVMLLMAWKWSSSRNM